MCTACRTIPNKDMQLDTFRGKTGLTLTFRPRDVYGKFHDFVQTFQKAAVTLTFAKRHTSKSFRYNATMRYASYSLHVRLRFSLWMHELSSARFQSASWVKRRDFVRTFQKAAVFVLLNLTRCRRETKYLEKFSI